MKLFLGIFWAQAAKHCELNLRPYIGEKLRYMMSG